MTGDLERLLPPPDRAALFLDFDGTLVDLAPRPDAIEVPAALIRLLPRLRLVCGGALAIVSGRGLADLDRLLAPLRLTTVAEHGAEVRHADGSVTAASVDLETRTRLQLELQALAAEDRRLLLEEKGLGLAVHYRAAPDLKTRVESRVAALTATIGRDFELQRGKMVAEARPRGVSKGKAILTLMESEPFAGRTPVFAGDDLTDEPGFAVVDAMGGISIKVGAGESRARHQIADVAAMTALLTRYAGATEAVA